MDLLIVNDGLEAAHNAGLAGPRVNITTIKLGDAIFTPDVSMTDLQGTLLHTASVNSFSVINANNIQYEVVLDESIGDFTFNEIGLFLDSGELFAIGVTSVPIFKEKQILPTIVGNRIVLRLQLQLSNLTNVLDFTLVTSGLFSQYANNVRTATFIDPNTATLVDDQTLEFHPGRRLKASLTSGPDVFSYIDTSSFLAGITTITVTEPIFDATLFAVDHGTISAGTSTALPSTLLTVDRTIPASASSGKKGEVAYDDSFLYICVEDNGWKRIALSIF